MKKHGWQEGQGLGKKLQGRADPLQVNQSMNKEFLVERLLFI